MSVKVCELQNIHSVAQFYHQLQTSLALEATFGQNLDALYDSLSTDIEGPIFIYWHHYREDAQRLGEKCFKAIQQVFEDIQAERPDFFVYMD